MTSAFPGSPKILKGAIVGIDLFNPLSSVAIFQYNPEQISRSVTPQYSEAGGGRAEPLRLQGPPQETISANLTMNLIDQMEEGKSGPLGGGIAGYLAALEMLIYPRACQLPSTRHYCLPAPWRWCPPSHR